MHALYNDCKQIIGSILLSIHKATPSDTLVSGPEVFLLMSLSISPYESHYFANEYHYHTILYHMDHSAHA